MPVTEMWIMAICLTCGIASMAMYIRADFRREMNVVTYSETITYGMRQVTTSHVDIEENEPPGNKQMRYAWFASGMVFLLTGILSLFLTQPPSY
jgi:hypothetical protein